MTAAPVPILDHIVILVPHSTLTSLPTWLTHAFTVLPGGRHADGATENKLVLLRDGVYLELIAFVPGQDDGRARHRWGARREGHIVDWANSLRAEDDLEVIRGRVALAGSGIRYGESVPGGRIRPDGVELRWITSSPFVDGKAGEVRDFVGGEVPFWCLDRTPRDLRVPYKEEGHVRHPSGVVGFAGVSDEGLFDTLKKTYDALQGEEGAAKNVAGAVKTSSWDLHVPEVVGSSSIQRTLTLILISSGDAVSPLPDVSVEISFISDEQEGTISGHLGDEKWLVKFTVQKS